ncbi:hypothetical protein NIES4073_52480 [Kalymmatonema gypsitolerans NIES-4073]|nr:hypothetical protein NIES4073_52480 [Scytonema sp. NIES-4073]
MNTAQKLEAITDEGKFEILVTSVLRKYNEHYAAIIHTGINAHGKPIKSPVDGFCLVPGSVPCRFLLVEHTTTRKDGLQDKWLFDHSTAKSTKVYNGDLLKAGHEAQKLREYFPDAQFTIILTTNQHLPKGIELLNKVYKKAKELGLDVDIWEQSRLADFLDSTPEGQWLRKEYLGIEAQMPSETLLRDLCAKSLANYEKEFFTNPDGWVLREIESQIEKGIDNYAYTIQLLIGESGSGKSAVAYRILKKHLDSGGFGLWVTEELLRECTTLEVALDRVLQNLYPNLLPDSGKTLLKLIPQGSRLLLIVDDVNRADNPTRVVQKLINWSKPQQSSTPNLLPIFSPYFIVCPVWSKISSSISLDFKDIAWVDPVFISSMNSVEGIAAVTTATLLAGIEITNTEASSVATKLGNDPILIGLFSSLLSNINPCELPSLAENIIERFITTTIEASSSSGNFLENEYRAALSNVATHMLKNKKLYPLWTEIKNWLQASSEEFTALRELLRHKKLCRLTPEEEERFVFRHDRIQEAFLVKSMVQLLTDATLDSDILYEPFYAEIIGRAIVRSPQNQEFLGEQRNRLPLALVDAIRCFSTSSNDYHQAIIEEVKEWVNSRVATGSVPESVLDAVCLSLWETNSPIVLEITEKMPQRHLVLLARFRNGCTVSGVRYCIFSDQSHFTPAIRDVLRDQALEQAKHYYKEKLLRELKQLLKSCTASDEERRGTLALAGFLGFTDLQDEIKTCWLLVKQKTQVLAEAIWAAIQCCIARPKKLLDELMTYWDSLPDEHYGYGDSHKANVTAGLTLALCHGTSDEVISYFIAQSKIHKSLHQHINYIFQRIDAPDAIEFVVRSAADTEIGNDPDRLARVTVRLADAWNPYFPDSRKMSKASMNRLKTLWKDPKNDNFLKEIAFHVWQMGVEEDEINTLRRIPSNSPLYRRALWKRAELGDHSVVPNFLLLLSKENYGFSVAHHVWCDKIMVEVKRYLNTFKDSIPQDFSGGNLHEYRVVSRLLTMIPTKDAETLLDECWCHLGYSPLFISTAIYIGTDRCLELVADSMSKCPDGISIFDHLSINFNFLDTNSEKYFTVKQLECFFQNLLPYLNRLEQFELWQLAEACNQFGISQWSQKHIFPRLPNEYRIRCHSSEDDLLNEVKHFAVSPEGIRQLNLCLELIIENQSYSSFNSFKDYLPDKVKQFANTLEGVDKLIRIWLNIREPQRHLIPNVMKRLLASYPTVRTLQIAATCIQVVGTRKNLSILDQYSIEGSTEEIAKIKKNTQFAVYRRSLY